MSDGTERANKMSRMKKELKELIDWGLNPEFCSTDFLAAQGWSPTMPWRFIAKVNKDGPIVREELGQCWIWMGTDNGLGYGKISRGRAGRRAEMTSHVCWCLHYGPLPQAKSWVLHKCDNPLCINPQHLFPGTQAENNKDMFSKGRALTGFMKNPLRGALHTNCKLSQEQVAEIRSKYAPRHYSQRKLANEYNVSQHTVWSIVHGVHWSWL